MLSLNRTLRITVPAAALVLGATLFVNGSTHAASCAHPTVVMSALQKLGLAHLLPCDVVPIPAGNGTGEVCANVGHHCNDGTGAGKCRNEVDATNTWSCQCAK